jgi:DNA-binding SARP family transcriptional activator
LITRSFPGALRREDQLLHTQEYEFHAEFRAHFFGGFRVTHRGAPLGEGTPRREKGSQVLRWLLLNPLRPVAADELIEVFWPDQDPGRALAAFHVTLHSVRRLLEPDLPPRRASSFIHRGPGNFYHFDPADRWWSDVDEVDRLITAAHACEARGEVRRAGYYYRKFSNFCAMGFLPDERQAEWLAPYRQRYAEMHTLALTRLIQIARGVGPEEEVLDYAYRLLGTDNGNELAIEVIVDAYARAGNTGHAAWRLEHFLHLLTNELRVSPSVELLQLRERLRSAGSVAARAIPA